MRTIPAPHNGLTNEEARRRLVQHGPNEIQRPTEVFTWVLLGCQFNSPLIWLLAAACTISVAIGEAADAIAIASIVALNGFIGFFQERRAEHAILALRSMTAPRARVRRASTSRMVPAAEIVPGDIVLLEPGDIVPADARLLEAHALSTNESLLTGESAPVDKSTAPARLDAPLAERTDSVFMGTAVANGTAVAEVFATGMTSELDKIAHLLSIAEEEATPLQRRIADVSRVLLRICLGIVAVVAGAGLLRGGSGLEVLMSAVSLAALALARSLAFATLVFGELFRAFAARSMTRIFWSVGPLTNIRLLAVVIASSLVQIGIHSTRPTQMFFHIEPLSPRQWVLAFMIGLGPVTILEVEKLARRLLTARRWRRAAV